MSDTFETGIRQIKARTAVFEAVGAASVCWHENGVFNEQQAIVVANRLISQLEELGYEL